MEVMPANTPMDMATSTPHFSFRFIVNGQMSFQGTRARIMSITPE